MVSAVAPTSRRPAPLDGAAARRTLRRQVALLEGRLAVLAAEVPICADPPFGAGPRLLGLGELERSRDTLLCAIDRARDALARREERRAWHRRKLERMLAQPLSHPFARVRLADLGEPGCGAYMVRPRLGLVGMLAGWWRVVLSSGCP
jgi:hypothetical protein